MGTHTREKRYCCQECGKNFLLFVPCLRTYGHTGKNPCDCQICGKIFAIPCLDNAHACTNCRETLLLSGVWKIIFPRHVINKAHWEHTLGKNLVVKRVEKVCML